MIKMLQMDIPDDILEAANKVSNFAKKNGWERWELAGIADRSLISALQQELLASANKLDVQGQYIDRAKWVCANYNILTNDGIIEIVKRLLDNRAALRSLDNKVENHALVQGNLKNEDDLIRKLLVELDTNEDY